MLVAGSDVTLAGIRTSGSPLDAVAITGRANGRGYAGPVTVRGSTFAGERRNGISVVGAIGVTIASNAITGAGNAATESDAGPWAGIDVEPDVPTDPIAQLTIAGHAFRQHDHLQRRLRPLQGHRRLPDADHARSQHIYGNESGNSQW